MSEEKILAELAHLAAQDPKLAAILPTAGSSLEQIYWALLRAGWHDDDLVARVRMARLAPAAAS